MYTKTIAIILLQVLSQSFCQTSTAQHQIFTPDTVGDVLTLEQAIDIGIRNNLMVNEASFQMQTGLINADRAMANMLPVINGSVNQTIGFGRTLNTYDYTYTNQVNSGNYGINASLNLFSGLQVQHSIRQSKYTYAAGKMDLQQQKDNLSLSIVLAYLQVISSKELLTIAREQAAVDSLQLNRLNILNEEGALLLLSNLSDLKGKYADDKVNVSIAANNLESARIGLFELLNVPYKRNTTFESIAPLSLPPDNVANADLIYPAAVRTIPSAQSATLQVHAAEQALLVAKGRYYPTLSLSGGIATNYYSLAYNQVATTSSSGQPTAFYFLQEGRQVDILTTKQNYEHQKLSFSNQFVNNKAAFISIQLSIPILNSFQTRNNIKLARVDLTRAQVNEKSVRLRLQREIEQAYQNSIAAYQQYKSYMDETAAYKESFRITQIRFHEGTINSDVYVLAKNNFDRANINLVVARYNYIFRTKVMDYYQGQSAL